VRLALELAAFADRAGACAAEKALSYLGAAHGWGGVAHALLRWSQACSDSPPAEALDLLVRLNAHRRPSGRWPIRAGSRVVYRGWCHGSAGWAQLWTLAWQLTAEEWFLSLAEASAEDAVAAEDEDNASLCCGRAGQGFAALTLYRATGERRWLTAANRVAAEAVHALADDTAPDHRLFSGELGVALLVAELEDPDRAAMPVYEALACAQRPN
jgi:serine/threonine-protein kinase